LADQHQVSRKFVYLQLGHAHDALDQAFAPPAAQPPQFLFWLPVTKPWLRQLVLGLTLICHSSVRGVHELLADLFDYPLSVGSIHNILQQAVAERGLGILIVEHDMALVMAVCQYLYVLDFGTLIFEGTPAEVQASELVRAAYLGSEAVEAAVR